MAKSKKTMFPKCVDKRMKRDCFWLMEDGTCSLLTEENKGCTFYKTALGVALAHEKRERLVRERGIDTTKYEFR